MDFSNADYVVVDAGFFGSVMAERLGKYRDIHDRADHRSRLKGLERRKV